MQQVELTGARGPGAGASAGAGTGAGAAPTGRGEVVVLVRDIGTLWVARLAEVVRAAGCRVALVTGPGDRDGRERAGSVVDRVAVVDDPTDELLVADAVRKLAGADRLGAVLSTTDGCVSAAAAAAELAGLRRTPAGPIAVSRNKYAAREAMSAAGLSGPRFGLLAGEAGAAAVAGQVGMPAVIKPLSGTGSHLVRRVNTVPELAAAYRWLTERIPQGPLRHLYGRPLACGEHGPVDATKTVLVESRLDGREFCVDVIVREGVVEQLVLVDKFLIDERYFELGFVSPPFDLPPERERRIRAVVDDAVIALGLDNTVAHVEVIDDEAIGPAIVEVNAGRPGGQVPTMLNRLATGVDTVAELTAVSRGARAARTPPELSIPLASLKMFPAGTGRLRAVRGLAEVAAHPDVVAVAPAVQPGDLITDEHEVHAAGVVVAGFVDRDDLVSCYHELAAMISLELEPPSGMAAGEGGR